MAGIQQEHNYHMADKIGDVPTNRSNKPDAIEQLSQGWTDLDRKLYYETTQGSKLVPYAWYKNLEQAGSAKPFNDHEHLDKLGFLFAAQSKDNPGALPIGFAIEKAAQAQAGAGKGTEKA